MNLNFEVFSSMCGLKSMTINGIEADESDFGYTTDLDPSEAPKYGCGNRQFVEEPATEAVLAKYGISLDDYDAIVEELKEALAFGRCQLCA